MASSNHSLNSICHGISSSSKHDLASNPLQQQLSLPDTELIAAEVIADAHNDDSSELYDVIADIKLPHELQLDQQQKKEASLDCDAATDEHSYVGVEKVPGRTRWPYRAVLSLPAWVTGDSCHDTVMCESYHSTAEAAARAVDAVCMVLLGRQAAVNFPASSYDSSDLEDAFRYIRCISGGAFSSSCGCIAGSKVGLGRPAAAAVTVAAVMLGATLSLDSRGESDC